MLSCKPSQPLLRCLQPAACGSRAATSDGCSRGVMCRTACRSQNGARNRVQNEPLQLGYPESQA
jgi:hypothetical protein